MWTYFQRTGGIVSPEGVHVGDGYSGHGPGVNNPAMEAVRGVGPIPEGLYTMGEIIEEHPDLGAWVIPLVPDPGNQMFGRDDFFIHGDEVEHPGAEDASHGCIVTGRPTRRFMGGDPDRQLRVTA